MRQRDKQRRAQQGLHQNAKCVIETGRNTIKYQARVSYKPDGSKTVQRNALEPSTPQRRRRALQIATYEAKLAGGMDPWDGAEIRSQHKRGQVWPCILMLRRSHIHVCLKQGSTLLQAPPMRTGRRRKVSTKGNLSASAKAMSTVHMATRVRSQANLQGRNTRSCRRPSETLPATPMSAWLLQDAGPWVALQSMDGSGELRY